MKKILKLIFLTLVFTFIMVIGAMAEDIKVYVGTEKLSFTKDTGIAFFDENDRTMVPMRAAMEAFGVDVDWVAETESAILTKNGTKLTVKVGSDKLLLNDKTEIKIDTKAIETGGRIYVPIRAVAEAFGGYVLWCDPICSVFILDNGYIEFRDSFTYDGEFSKYAETVVVSAMYKGNLKRDEFVKFWTKTKRSELEVLLRAVAIDKQGLNPEHHISINFWYPKDKSSDKDYYIANVSSFSYATIIYNPFEKKEINDLNH